MASCPSCVRASIHQCVNSKYLLLWNHKSDFDKISQKCFFHGPLQNFLKEFDTFKNSGFHGNKTWKFFKYLKIFLSETIRIRATEFGMPLYIMGLYQVSSNYSPGVKLDPSQGSHKFYMGLYRKNFRILPVCSHEAWVYHILHIPLSSESLPRVPKL